MCDNSRRNIILLFVTIITIMFFNKVDASTCTATVKNNLKTEAEKVEIVPYLNEEYNPMHVYKYNVYITNLSENIYIIDSNGERYEYDEFQDADSVFGMFDPGSKVYFSVYGSNNTECNGVKLATRTITFDYYNDYSTREECKGIEEFALCKRNYNGKIESDEWFEEKVKEYKAGNGDVDVEETGKTPEEKVNIELVIIIVSSIIVVGLAILFIYFKIKNKDKVKIKIKDEKDRSEEYEKDE